MLTVRSSATLLISLVAAALVYGNGFLIATLIAKYLNLDIREVLGVSVSTVDSQVSSGAASYGVARWLENVDTFLARFNLAGAPVTVLLSVIGSLGGYHGVCGFLQYYYYVRRKADAKEWKCQPEKFLPESEHRHQVLLGTMNMCVAGTLSGLVATYFLNNGRLSKIYFDVGDYGWPYLLLSVVLLFVVEDAFAYYAHLTYHLPFLYRRIHKWHHRYTTPTAYACVSMHPIEFLTYNTLLVLPVFMFPIHVGVLVGMLLYIFWHGMIDHSGIYWVSPFPWQHVSKFHDDHHKFFHVNFGLNSNLFDSLHGTVRQADRIYGEDVFYGKGKKAD